MVHQQKKIKYDEFKNSGVITLFRDKELTMKGEKKAGGGGKCLHRFICTIWLFIFIKRTVHG